MKEIKKLSLIIPTYKQESTVLTTLRALETSLKDFPFSYELIFVVDGFHDKTYDRLKKAQKKRPAVKVYGYEKNEGKGFAVRFGMLQGTGDVIGFIDGDLDIDPTGISMLVNHMIWYDADIIIGSKLHPVSKVQYPFFRKILSWGYRTFIRLLFGLKVRDTQVGIKFFKKKVVEDVFPRLLVKRFAFDIEILAVAYNRGFTRIYEAPIKLRFQKHSSIRPMNSIEFWKVIYRMIVDTLAVFYRMKILHYYDKVEVGK